MLTFPLSMQYSILDRFPWQPTTVTVVSFDSKDAFGPSFTHEVLEKNVYGSNIE